MKIITRKQLMESPSGTVWSYYEPCIFNGLHIKDSEPFDGFLDFVVSDLIGAVRHVSSEDFVVKCEQMEAGESLPVDFELTGREGMFDDKQLFAIYEKVDIENLITRLQNTPHPQNGLCCTNGRKGIHLANPA